MRIHAGSLVVSILLLGSATVVAQSSPPATSTPQFGYASLKVQDLPRSLQFYTTVLGMTEGRRLSGGADVTEVLLGYGSPPAAPGVMLIRDAKHTQPYDLGDGFSRLILYVPDLQSVAAKVAAAKAVVVRDITRIEAVKVSIMLIKDPDGYLIELIQRG